MKEYPSIESFFVQDSKRFVPDSQEQIIAEYMDSVTAKSVNKEQESMMEASQLVLCD